MWIKTSRDGLRRLFNADVIPDPDELDADVDVDDFRIQFSEKGTANVKEQVAQAYIAHYDDISEHSESDSE